MFSGYVMIDDHILTTQGLIPGQPKGQLLLIACGALAREIVQILELNCWTHIDLTCLPAILHNHPEKITPAVCQAINKYKNEYEKIFVAYADCGTGGVLLEKCKRLGVEMIPGPHCYSFYEGNSMFAKRDESSSFFLTDFLVRQFDSFVWKPLGLDKNPELLEVYFGNYTKVVYQAQTNDSELTIKAKDCAKRMNLEFERRFTGYGDLAKAIKAQS